MSTRRGPTICRCAVTRAARGDRGAGISTGSVARRTIRATDPVEIRAPRSRRAVAIERGAVALPVVAEAISAGQAQRQTETPTVPVRGRLGVGDEGVAALRAGAGIEGDTAEIRLGAVGEAHRTRPVIVPREPEPVD